MSIRENFKDVLRRLLGQPAHEGHSIAGHPEGWPKTQEDFEEFWASNEAMDFYFEPSRLAFFNEVLAHVPGRFNHVLDIGCGNGYFLKRLAQREGVDGNTYVGTDYAENGLVAGRQLLPKATFVQADAGKLPLPNDQFEVVVMMETLEHLENWQDALNEAWRVAAPGGKLFITVPDGIIDNWIGHTNFWSETEFKTKLETFGSTAIHRIDQDRTLLGIVTKSTKSSTKPNRKKR